MGRLVEQKGHLVLVDAVAQLVAEGRDLEVALVGDGPRGEIERRVERSGLAGKVLLLGWRDDAGVRDELEPHRALVLPSFAEGLPVVLMEALALGRPAISTYVAGIPELIEPGVNGWLVPPGSVRARPAMGECLDAPADLMARMGARSPEAILARHNVVTEAARLAGLFAGELSRARSGEISLDGVATLAAIPSRRSTWSRNGSSTLTRRA